MGIVTNYIKQNPNSERDFKEAARSLPGGSTRSALYWPPFPLYMDRGKGTRLWDVDGNERIDFNFNNTSLILGHNYPRVVSAVKGLLEKGFTLGSPTELEPKLAEELVGRLKGADLVRFTPSGTEANMQAIRLARSFTGKNKFAKCIGAYHGSYDAVATTPKATTGVPNEVLANTLFFPYNNTEAAEALVKKHKDELAVVVVEPTQRDMTPRPGFLEAVREVTEQHNIPLIFDEVISFRLSHGGAQEYYGVTPDITCMGKIIGGGYPVGAYASTEEIMEPLMLSDLKLPEISEAKLGFSGTFNAHPVSMTAGMEVMKVMQPSVYDQMSALGSRLRKRLKSILNEEGVAAHVGGAGSFFHIIWTDEDVFDFETSATGNRVIAKYFTLGMMNRGIFYLGHTNLSTITTEDEVNSMLEAARGTLEELKPLVEEYAPNLLTL
jgi:glutamate-1-semialdehyde 2,1-aminomutase